MTVMEDLVCRKGCLKSDATFCLWGFLSNLIFDLILFVFMYFGCLSNSRMLVQQSGACLVVGCLSSSQVPTALHHANHAWWHGYSNDSPMYTTVRTNIKTTHRSIDCDMCRHGLGCRRSRQVWLESSEPIVAHLSCKRWHHSLIDLLQFLFVCRNAQKLFQRMPLTSIWSRRQHM